MILLFNKQAVAFSIELNVGRSIRDTLIMLFSRLIIKKLQNWAVLPDRKPLILRGARQVGKTVAVQLFGKQYDHFINLNLDIQQEGDIFRRNLPVHDIYQAILLKHKIPSDGKPVLLFLDEIQNCPEAVEMLRYFYEKLPDVLVIAAGSLLEIALHKKNISFPVGRVEHAFMYPLSFQEFLTAQGADRAVELIDTIPFPSYAYDTVQNLFHRYTLVGGMPEVVAKYLQTNDVTTLSTIYDSLLLSYTDDIEKYARNATMAIILRHCLEAAPFVAGQRITFAGFGQSNYRSREVGEALKTLQRTMLINLLHPSTSLEIPIVPDLKKKPRLQFLDTGLVNYFAGLQDQHFLYSDLHSFHKGILAEHIVGQELISQVTNTRKKQCFWVREKTQSQAEVDFIVHHRGLIIPIEVKAGPTGRLRSLHQFIDRCPHNYAVRLYAGKLEIQQVSTAGGKKFTLLNLPYFLASQINAYLDRLPEQSTL